MEIRTDISANFPSTQTFSRDSSMFFCRSNSEQENQQQQQYRDPNRSIEHHPMAIMMNKRPPKRTISFPFGKCRICYDRATGVHYGVITCEGCKGFFKRSITQGIPYRCFFGDKCLINLKTRNRCKACRFKRCLEQGMAMESVKMGRIPKKVKEKALKSYHKQQERQPYDDQDQSENIQDDESYYNEELDEFDTDNYSLSSMKRESTSSLSSYSSSSTSSMNIRQSTDSNQEIIVLPQKILHRSEQPLRTVDLIELTISSSNLQIDNLNNNLSTLRLPDIFYESYSSPDTLPDALSKNPIKSSDKSKVRSDTQTDHLSENLKNNNTMMTVSRYISKINENTLVDYMFSCELRYSKNVLQIMKYLATKLYQPFLIYELDFEVTSFFRYIRWKMLNLYLKHTQRLRTLVERMFGIINLGITDFPGVRATPKQMWDDVQASITTHVNGLLDFARDSPGINELNVSDFTRILNNRVFDFWIIYNYPLFYQNESYLMTINGLHYSRFFMNQFIGKKTTDAFHDFSQRLHTLNITQVEHSLIIPIVMCLPDEQLTDSGSVHIIKYCYMYALYIQLCTTRTEDEAKSVFDQILQIVNSIAILNQLCKENIGELLLEKPAPRD